MDKAGYTFMHADKVLIIVKMPGGQLQAVNADTWQVDQWCFTDLADLLDYYGNPDLSFEKSKYRLIKGN